MITSVVTFGQRGVQEVGAAGRATWVPHWSWACCFLGDATTGITAVHSQTVDFHYLKTERKKVTYFLVMGSHEQTG